MVVPVVVSGGGGGSRKAHGATAGPSATNATPRYEDGETNAAVSPVHRPFASGTGKREPTRVHTLNLQSAYALYKDSCKAALAVATGAASAMCGSAPLPHAGLSA